MRRLLLLLIFLLGFPAWSLAANHYIRQGAAGTGSGLDWTNACTDFTGACAVGSLVRGDTYYVADGTYAGRTFSTAASGTTLITIKKATVADHGIATGWSDSFGDGACPASTCAQFSGAWVFTTPYWLVDGQTGGGLDQLDGRLWVSGHGDRRNRRRAQCE